MIHVYTGDGKGKTTAALGLCFRAAGYELRTLIIQFMKKGVYGETLSALKSEDLVTIEQYGTGEFYYPESSSMNEKTLHLAAVSAGIKRALEVLAEKSFDIIVLDEILNAVNLGLADEEDILDLILKKYRDDAVIVLTGRNASDRIIENADIVTEMKKIRHCYDNGIKAREGLEF